MDLYGAIGVKCSSLMISSTCSIRWRLSPRPDPTFAFAAERSDGQGWPKAIAKRLAFDGREHSGRLVRSGEAGLWCWDSLSRYVSVGIGRRYRGELAIRRCPCRKLTPVYIDGAVRPKLARPTS